MFGCIGAAKEILTKILVNPHPMFGHMVCLRISTRGDNVKSRLIRGGHFFEGALIRRGRDMITFLIHHLHINTNRI